MPLSPLPTRKDPNPISFPHRRERRETESITSAQTLRNRTWARRPMSAPPPPASSWTAPGFWAPAPRSCPKLCVSAKRHGCTLWAGGTPRVHPPHTRTPLGGACACSRDGRVCVRDRVAGAWRACKRAGVCCTARVCKGMCVHGVAGQAWRVQLGAYAEPAGRWQCPWQQPRPRRWKPEAGSRESSIAFAGQGISKKASMPGWRGDSPHPCFLPPSQGSVCGVEGGHRGWARFRRGAPWACRGRPVAHWVGGRPHGGSLSAAQ